MTVQGHGWDDNVGAPAFRNAIINGAFLVDQRNVANGTSFGGGGIYFSDRFFSQSSGGGSFTCNGYRSTDVPTGTNFVSSHRIACSVAKTGTTYTTHLTTRLEGYDVGRLGISKTGKTVTLSFWVKSTRAGVYGVTLSSGYRGGTTYTFLYYPATYTISAANTWQYVTINIPSYAHASWITDNANNGLEITFNIADGTSSATGTPNTWVAVSSSGYFNGPTGMQTTWGDANTDNFYITGVQLEAGPVATPFEFEPFETTLRKCQRYYYRLSPSSSQWIGSGVIRGASIYALIGAVPLPVYMRQSPAMAGTNLTVELPNGTGVAMTGGSWSTFSTPNNGGFFASRTTSTFPSDNGCFAFITSGGYLEANAEL